MTHLLATPLATLSGADVLGLIVSFLVCVYLVYALLRGEKL
ncbi:MAG: potassium-transporting ATPase subunit F [Actinobacteria bacterium]|nr:potassium-transporting ATPase subunit F [Actinomycetota bacterium]